MTGEEQLRELYIARHRNVQAFFVSRGVALHEVDDLVQSSFQTLWEKRSRIFDDKAESFLFGIAARTLMTYRRKQHRRYLRSQEKPLANPEPDPTPPPELSAMMDEHSLHLERAVGQLPPRMQEVVRLVHLSGLTRAEAARQLGISSQAVEKSERRALALLKEVLSDSATKG